jgi:penicillin-binding protein 1A
LDTLSYRDSLWHYHRLLNGAVFMMEPATGAVRAWVGGNDHRYLPYDLVKARRPIASTIKPVVYAAALERGLGPCTYLDNDKKTYAEFEDWSPDNFDRDTVGGQVAMWYALMKSMNRPTVDLYFRTGTDTVRTTMKALGLPTRDADSPAMALGATDIALREIVPAYGAFAMRGKVVKPQLILSITNAQGKVIHKAKAPKGQQAITEASAATITAMLQRAVDQGTGASIRSRYGVTIPLAGKTGTSQDFGDAWFLSYNPELVIGTWVGAFENDVHFSSATGTGGQLALPIAAKVWKDIERAPDLRKRYSRAFTHLGEDAPDLNCDPHHEPSALEQLIQDVFGRKDVEAEEGHEEDAPKKENIFDRLFKKKE